MLEMNNRYFTKVLLFGMIIITTSLQAQVIPPYLNTDLSIDERVNDLVSRMTLEEKVSQMTHTSRGINRLGIPDYNWWNECLLRRHTAIPAAGIEAVDFGLVQAVLAVQGRRERHPRNAARRGRSCRRRSRPRDAARKEVQIRSEVSDLSDKSFDIFS